MKFGKKQQMRSMTQEDIDKSLEELFKGQKKVETRGEHKVAESREPIKRAGAPKLTFDPEPEPVIEVIEPYWDGADWEQWAYSMFKDYPETRKFLPDWFLQAIDEALKQ